MNSIIGLRNKCVKKRVQCNVKKEIIPHGTGILASPVMEY